MDEAGKADTAAGAPLDAMTVIAAVSHELRAPLTSLKGFTRLLLDRWEQLADGDKHEFVRQIAYDAARVERLVNELLEIGRIESGRLTLRFEAVDLAELAAGVVRRVTLSHPDLRCSIEASHELPAALVDRDKIEQVLTNLVENGAKYAPGSDITCSLSADADVLRVTVDDGGPGIPDHDLERVFVPFVRRVAAQPSGTGLGLWISRALVEAHGGTLVARRNAHGGASFCLTLPRSPRADRTPGQG